MIERLDRHQEVCCIRWGFTRPKIAVPAGMGRATDLEMDPVSCEKRVGRRPQFDLDTSASILLRLVLFFALIETQ